MLLSNTSEEASKTGFRCIYDAPKMSIHRDAAYLTHPDVFIYRNLDLIHRDGVVKSFFWCKFIFTFRILFIKRLVTAVVPWQLLLVLKYILQVVS